MSQRGTRDQTSLVNSRSTTYSVTGWRVGWVISAPDIAESVRKVHDFLTVGAPTPLQQAGVVALSLPSEYYAKLALDYTVRRDAMLAMLERVGFRCVYPRGAYYIMADFSNFGFANDYSFARHLLERAGIAA